MGPRLKDVEDLPLVAGLLRTPLASMGPRLKDVEDIQRRSIDSRKLGASMGPRLKDVEDTVHPVVLIAVNVLQWGHVSRTWKTP